MPGHLIHRRAIYFDLSLIHIIETHQQIDQRGLAAAGGTYDGNPLSRLYIQIKMLNQLPPRQIGERHVLCRHISFYILQLHCILRLRRLGFLLDQLKDPGSAGNGVLKLRHHSRDLVERFGILVGVA